MNILDMVRSLRAKIVALAEYMTDEEAVEAKELFERWKPGEEYIVGKRLYHDGKLYRVLTTHTSQEDWKPDVAASLFAEVLIPDPGTIPEWVQPSSTNPYMKGDKVTHNGKTWESDIDNNVWEPGVYGWSDV